MAKKINLPADTDHLYQLAYESLTDRFYSLWGQAFDIHDPKRRKVAAEWMVEEMSKLAELHTKHQGEAK